MVPPKQKPPAGILSHLLAALIFLAKNNYRADVAPPHSHCFSLLIFS